MEEDFSNMFTVTPMSQDIRLEPGKTYTGKITIANPADAKSNFEYRATVTPYTISGENYQADLATVTNSSKIVDWIKIENPTGSIEPNHTLDVNYTITVPKDAAGGGQYATISIGSNTESAKGNGVSVNNIFEMASIIYARVSGEINHGGEILENSVPGFSTVVPVTVTGRLTNTGNVHEAATIIIKATNFFTGEVILPSEDNEGTYTELTMPDSERFISREISNLPLLGVIKVEQTIYYLGDVKTESKNVIICPIWFMALILLTIGSIVYSIIRIVKGHRKKRSELL